MPKSLMIFATAALISAPAAFAGLSVTQADVPSSDPIAHSGGCRKDSPPGQCCHAGSKPFHCH